MYALEVNKLTKTYANGVEALKGISLNVEEGDFFAFLGPNGAGKSTLIGIISSLVNASSGESGYLAPAYNSNARRPCRLLAWSRRN